MLVEVVGQFAHLLLRVIPEGLGDIHLVTADLDSHIDTPLALPGLLRGIFPGEPHPPR
jgi:hypothetical protein